MNCQQVAGFLIPRPCPNLAVAICSVCGKNICQQHTAATPQGAQACTSCAADRNAGTYRDDEDLRNYYGYNQTVFHTQGLSTPVYTQSDYQAFDGGGATGTMDPDTDMVEDLTGS